MEPNPLLEKLGFQNSDRVVIFHADDIGMCQAGLSAYEELVEFGLLSSAAAMVPCPWFRGAADFCRRHPHVDMGVHLTLNSEWDHYRWAPISTLDPSSGLMDAEGCFHHWTEETHAAAEPAAVQKELAAQLDRALAAGIDVTHIDTHMGTVAHIKFIAGYVQLAMERCLPPMILRMDAAMYESIGLDPQTAAFAAQMSEQLEAQGLPLLDNIHMMSLEDPNQRVEQVKAALQALPAGVTHFIIHPAKDTPEIRAITPDWQCRVADFEAFTSPELRDYVHASDLKVIGYREIKNTMR